MRRAAFLGSPAALPSGRIAKFHSDLRPGASRFQGGGEPCSPPTHGPTKTTERVPSSSHARYPQPAPWPCRSSSALPRPFVHCPLHRHPASSCRHNPTAPMPATGIFRIVPRRNLQSVVSAPPPPHSKPNVDARCCVPDSLEPARHDATRQ